MRPPPPARLPRALLAALAVAALIHFIPACGGGGGNDGGESATIAFAAADSSGDESVTPAHVQIALSAPLSTDPASVDVAVTGGTANAGSDFTLRATTVTIPAGQTQATVDLDVAQDGFDEPDETVELTLSNPRSAGIAALTLGAARVHTYTIKAQSASGSPTLSFRAPTMTVDEGVGSATVTVELSRAAAGPVTVDYAVTGGNASPGTDFSLVPGTLTFPAGSLTQSFSIPIADDQMNEDDETIRLTLSNASGAQIGGPATATLTIADNDAAPLVAFASSTQSADESDGTANLQVVLSAASGRDVTVNATVAPGGTASGSGVDYAFSASTLTIPAGQTSASLPVTIVEDTLAEGNEQVSFVLSSPTNATLGNPGTMALQIIDNDGLPLVGFATDTSSALENGGPATITVTLSSASLSTVNVTYAVTGGTATPGIDYNLPNGTVTFTPGQTSRTITVGLQGDSIDEDNETIILTLSNPVNAALGARSVHTFSITDDDPSAAVAFATAAFNAAEAVGTATVAVNLTGTTARTVSVNYSVTSGTATGGGVDYTLAAGTLTYAPGDTSKTISIPIVNDALNEVTETIVISLSSPTNGVLGPVSTTTCSIQDDDPLPTISFGAATSSTSESGTPSIPVTLSTASGRTVTVSYAVGAGGTATGGGTDYTLPAGTLTFPAGTTSLNVPITLNDDSIDEANETVPITLSGPVGATLAAPFTHTLTITDDDPPPTINFQLASSSGSEGTTQVFLVVSLSNASSQTVTVNYSRTGGTATPTNDFSLGGTALSFTPGITNQNVLINVVNDTLDEDDETVTVTLATPTNGTLGTQTTHTYTITDNDPIPTVQFLLATSSQPESVLSPPVAVTLSSASGRTVTVPFSVTGGTATSGSDYSLGASPITFAAGTTSVNLPLTVVNDTAIEPDETIVFQLGPPTNATVGTNGAHTFTIVNND
ncbi:MAG TPA: Calx-beta domain-containing protein [Myxococcaceae bacterium]|nr:Calx-beta domain-containing protein [Myxococcaceae bacterium]